MKLLLPPMAFVAEQNTLKRKGTSPEAISPLQAALEPPSNVVVADNNQLSPEPAVF